MESAVVVRRATIDDAEHIARVRVAAWQTAYRGLIPDEVLDAMDAAAEGRHLAGRWERLHADPRVAVLVAELDGVVVAQAVVGPERVVVPERTDENVIDDDGAAAQAPAALVDPPRGQLYAINVAPQAWGRGVGTALIALAEESLRAAGFTTAVLWVLDGNERAAVFYDRRGWLEDGVTQRDESLTPGHPLFERRRVKHLA
ncbi:GNAT family N-acetyltransferase [Salana multivorans]